MVVGARAYDVVGCLWMIILEPGSCPGSVRLCGSTSQNDTTEEEEGERITL